MTSFFRDKHDCGQRVADAEPLLTLGLLRRSLDVVSVSGRELSDQGEERHVHRYDD